MEREHAGCCRISPRARARRQAHKLLSVRTAILISTMFADCSSTDARPSGHATPGRQSWATSIGEAIVHCCQLPMREPPRPRSVRPRLPQRTKGSRLGGSAPGIARHASCSSKRAVGVSSDPASAARSFLVRPAVITHASRVAAAPNRRASRQPGHVPASARVLTGRGYLALYWVGELEVWLPLARVSSAMAGDRVPFGGVQVVQRQPSRGPGTVLVSIYCPSEGMLNCGPRNVVDEPTPAGSWGSSV